jgi:short chain dehydrogenase
MSLEWFSFAGRVARVTGEAQGLGRAVAEMLAGAGILLVIADCQADTLARTAAALTRQGDQVVRVPADVTHARQVRRSSSTAWRPPASWTCWCTMPEAVAREWARPSKTSQKCCGTRASRRT